MTEDSENIVIHLGISNLHVEFYVVLYSKLKLKTQTSNTVAAPCAVAWAFILLLFPHLQ